MRYKINYRFIIERFRKSWLFRFLAHTGFISIFLGMALFLFIDFSQDKYLFKKLKDRALAKFPEDEYIFYADLNNDGVQDRFIYKNKPDLNSMLYVYANERMPWDQYNFLGTVNLESTGYFVGDHDHDSLAEIACFSLKDKDIYLNIIEPYDEPTDLVKNRLIDTVWSTALNPLLTILDVQFIDLNEDGFDELVISLTSGLSLQPRKIYTYDIHADSLCSSPLTGSTFFDPILYDFDHDGSLELFPRTDRSRNYPDGSIPYPDTTSWYVVLNQSMNFKFPPVPMNSQYDKTFPYLIEKDSQSSIYEISVGEFKGNPYGTWNKLNPDFSLMPTDPLISDPAFVPWNKYPSASGRTTAFHDIRTNVLYYLAGEVPKGSARVPSFLYNDPIYNYRAGIPEFEFAFQIMGIQESILFQNGKGKKLGSFNLAMGGDQYDLSWMGKINGSYQICLAGKNYEYILMVTRNPWRYLQYLVLLGMIGGFYGFISLIRLIQVQQFNSREEMKKEILELQLKSVRNQLDPHFTFNALNALSALSLTGDQHGVDQFIGYFSRLLRNYLNTSDQVLISLRDEIEFVQNYVELQRIRFENRLSLELDISDEVDLDSKIPKMLIQTHVENSIKHGFSNLRSPDPAAAPGKILIRIEAADGSLIINLEDNGVGRGNSKATSYEKTGKGTQSLDRIINSVRQLYRMEIRQELEDMADKDGKPTGTKVIMQVLF